MRMATIHLILTVIGIGSLPPRAALAACAGPLLHWTDTYDAGGLEQGLAVAADPSGSVYAAGFVMVAGQGANWVVRKYTPDGAVLWTQTYNNATGNWDDIAQAVAVAPGGDVVVAGYEYTGTSIDWLIRRYTSGGALVWSVGYNSPANDFDETHTVAVSPTGEIWVGGHEYRPDLSQGLNWRLHKYSAAGGLLGSWTYNGPASGDDFIDALAVDAAGSVYVGGSEFVLAQDMNWRIVKYSAAGSVQWSDGWNSPANGYDLVHGIAVAGGEVTVAGHEDRPDLGQSRNWRIRRYTDAGALRWSVDYHGGFGFDDAYGVTMDPLGNAYLAGYAQTAGGFNEWRITRYGPGGAADWAIAGGNGGIGYAAAVDPGGAVDVVGFTTTGSGSDLHVRRYRQPACLGSILTVAPATVTIGQVVTVVFTVTNYGGAWSGVVPQAWGAGAGVAAPRSGPVPADASLPLGGSASFTWTFTATGAGALVFTATAAGWDGALGATVYTAAAAGANIQRPAAISGVLTAGPAAVRPGDAVVLVLSVSNSGDAAAVNLRPALRPGLAGGATAYLAQGPQPAGPVTLAGGATTSFTWVYTAGLVTGAFTLSASATGADANAGSVVTTGLPAAGAVAVSSPVEPCPATGSNLLVYLGLDSTGPDEGHAIAVTPSGSIFVAGAESNEAVLHQQDIVVLGIAPGGAGVFNSDRYGTAASVPDVGYGMAWVAAGGAAAVGRAANTGWIARYDGAGAQLWELTPPPMAGGPEVFRACAALPGGDVIVSGWTRRADLGQGDNVYVVRYDPAGAVVWSLNYNSPANSDDAAFAVAVDPSGSIYVAGFETRTDLGQDRNILVLKIGPNGGAPIWVRTYSSGPGLRDEARGIAVDAWGNVTVCGFETRTDLGQGENGWAGRWTAGGAASWTTTFNSPLVRAGGPQDRAIGVALDPSGSEVFITGRVERPGQAANILLRRYAAATGAFLEEAMRNGPANGDDEGHGIARGPDGDLYVTGFEDWNHVLQGANLIVHRWDRPGCLHAELTVSQSPVSTGQWVTVSLRVTSTASNPVTALTPALSIGPGGALVSLIGGPVPASVAALPPGGTTTFVWTYSASGTGFVTFTGTVSGIESASALAVSASAAATLLIEGKAALTLALAGPPSACTGQVIELVATVSNTGQAAAHSIAIAGDPVIAGSGALALMAGPVALTTLAGGAAMSLTWTYSVTGGGIADWTLTVTGADANSGLPLVAGPLTAGPAAIGAPSGLAAAASAPALAPVGSWVTVTLTVTNTGAGDAAGVTAQSAVAPGGSLLSAVGGVSPAGPQPLAAGTAQTFAWTWSVSGWGAAVFTLTATGADACGTARVSATIAVLLGTPAALVAGLVAAFPDPVCTGGALRVVVSVTNTGQVPALDVRGATPYVAGAAVLVAAPAWIPVLAGGASAHLTWTYSPTAAGPLVVTTTVTGLDARDGSVPVAGPVATPVITATAAAALAAQAAAPPSAIIGHWVTVTLTVTNTGGQDAVNVVPAASPIPAAAASPISGPAPAGPLTIPAGGVQTFAWTFSVSGSGPIVFSLSAAGQTCAGTTAILGTAPAALTGLRPAQLIADSLTLAPASVQAPGVVTAILTLRNGGDAPLVVGSLLRQVSGGSTTGLLAAGPALSPAPTLTLAGGATQAISWTHSVTLPCGIGTVVASATGYESATGRPLASASIPSNQVSITGAPISLAVTPSATAALVSTAVTITAVVRDACGLGVPLAPVTFTILEGGGALTVLAAVTSAAGVAQTTLTLGADLGRNAVRADVPGAGLSATASVDGTNPLALDDPGVALDRNVLDVGTGQLVLARIFPRNAQPVAVRVYTASGRLVRTLRKLTPLGRDQFIAEWDGLTEDGFKVARGVYLVQVLGGGLSQVLKVVVR